MDGTKKFVMAALWVGLWFLSLAGLTILALIASMVWDMIFEDGEFFWELVVAVLAWFGAYYLLKLAKEWVES